jgi:hypothetical protein
VLVISLVFSLKFIVIKSCYLRILVTLTLQIKELRSEMLPKRIFVLT